MEKIILEKVNEVVKKLQSDDKLMAQFKKEPVKALENILGVDLPDDVIEKIAWKNHFRVIKEAMK